MMCLTPVKGTSDIVFMINEKNDEKPLVFLTVYNII